MRVVMIGGAGFLGYFVCQELIRRGHDVVAVGLTPPAAGAMPEGVTFRALDTDAAPADVLADLLSGTDVLIHAAGADGRFAAQAPALDAFRARNVAPFHRLIEAMKRTGARRLVVLGSYYTALERSFPHLSIMARSAYPISRAEQAELAFSLAGDAIDVAILELPYIFGAAPKRGTLWGYVIDSVLNAKAPIPLPGGGTACVTAKQVGAAAAGAVERARGHQYFPIGGENLSHKQIYQYFADALGVERSFADLDPDVARLTALAQREKLAQAGRETGYDPVDLAYWQTQPLDLDPLPAMEALGYGPDDLREAIRETVHATRQYGGAGPASQSMESKS